jgi:hypothetical protein
MAYRGSTRKYANTTYLPPIYLPHHASAKNP